MEKAHVVIAMHGLDRAAAQFRDELVGGAERTGQLVLVPEFDQAQFSGIYGYNYGNVLQAPPGSAVLPSQNWSFGLIDRVFQYVRTAIGSDRDTFGLFGNSAGAQFVLRYLALTEARTIDKAVAANCGWYMLPNLTHDYPVGMGGLGFGEDDLRRYFQRRLTILLGEADVDINAHDLPRTEGAMAQGPHRLARGQWHFNHCRKLARSLNVDFGWKLRTIPEAGHIDPSIFENGIRSLAH